MIADVADEGNDIEDTDSVLEEDFEEDNDSVLKDFENEEDNDSVLEEDFEHEEMVQLKELVVVET